MREIATNPLAWLVHQLVSDKHVLELQLPLLDQMTYINFLLNEHARVIVSNLYKPTKEKSWYSSMEASNFFVVQ